MAAKTAIKEPKRSSALVRRETFASYCFLLPSLIFFLGFVIYPMVLCVVTSFFDSPMNRADIFVGLANYKELFTDPIFLGALKNTFIIVVVSVPVTCAFSLWVSSAIVDLPEWATSLFRCVFYLPVVTGSVAVTVVWKWMYNNYYGIFNYLGKTLGLIDKNINWLGDERFALGCIILILLTTSVGQPIVLYVSALGNVDQSIVEAAEVDVPSSRRCGSIADQSASSDPHLPDNGRGSWLLQPGRSRCAMHFYGFCTTDPCKNPAYPFCRSSLPFAMRWRPHPERTPAAK